MNGSEVGVLRSRRFIEKLKRCEWAEIGGRSPGCERPNHFLRGRQLQRLQGACAFFRFCVPLVHPVADDGIAVRQPPGLLECREPVVGDIGLSKGPHRIATASYFAHTDPVGDQKVAIRQGRDAPGRIAAGNDHNSLPSKSYSTTLFSCMLAITMVPFGVSRR